LKSHGLALNPSEEPCSIADTGGLEKESGLEEYKDNRVTQESNGEAGCNQLPCDGSENGSGDGSHESQVEHLLDTIRDTKDVLVFTNNNVDSGDTGDNEEAKSDSHLATTHESRKVTSTILEKAFAGAEGQRRRSTFGLGELGNCEESNLHTFEKTDGAHKNEEKDKTDSLVGRFSHSKFPGRGLSTVKGLNGDSKGESKNSKREGDTCPEENKGRSRLWGLVGFNRLSSGPVGHHSDQVGCVHDTGNFNTSSNPIGESHEMGVDVVKHHVGSVTLGSQLSNNDILQYHSNTGSEEDGSDPVGKSENFGTGKRSSAKTNREVNEDNHELTSHEVSVKVVSLVSPSGDLVGDRMGFAVEFTVNWGKTNHGALSSFNHGHPDDENPKDYSGSDGVDITGKLSVSGSDQGKDDHNGEDQKEKGNDNSDLVEGGVDYVGFGVRRHGE